LSVTCSFGRSPFLKKKVTGLEFILSPVEGLQSFLPQTSGRKARPNERIHFVRAGIYVEFTLSVPVVSVCRTIEGIPNAALNYD